MSLPRKLTALRFSAFISVMVSFFIVLTIFFEAVMLHGTSPSLSEGFKIGAQRAKLDIPGMFNSLPLIIFGFMYQCNIPAIYNEMNERNLKKGKSVLYIGTIAAIVCYLVAGIFGYVTFSSGNSVEEYDEIFKKQNILVAPYTLHDGSNRLPTAIYICLFGIMLVVIFATPFCVLPCKDSIEDLKGKKLQGNENIVYTFVLVGTSLVISLVLLNIGTIMTILGATTNSAIGFLLPICYYLKSTRKAPPHRTDRVLAKCLFVFIVLASIVSLVMLVLKFINN